ncbi:MAG: hypothetical protein ACK4ZN_02745, partial [Oceanibaculum sp.]
VVSHDSEQLSAMNEQRCATECRSQIAGPETLLRRVGGERRYIGAIRGQHDAGFPADYPAPRLSFGHLRRESLISRALEKQYGT